MQLCGTNDDDNNDDDDDTGNGEDDVCRFGGCIIWK